MNIENGNLLSNPPKKKEFIGYIHNFRGLAIIFVVACHLLLQWEEGSKMYLFLDMLWGNGTLLFVFIAGYLFQHLSKKYEYKDYILKKLKNVLIPYVLISIPIIAYRLYSNDVPGYILEAQPDFLSWGIARKIGYFLIYGAHMQPLWFVPMITLFYIAAPVFIFLDRHPKLYFLLIPLFAVSLMVDREPFSDIPRMFIHFVSVYVYGMFMSRYKEQYLTLARKYWILISLITVAAFMINYFYYDPYNNPLNYIHKMLFCAFFIYWLWRLDRFMPKFLTVLAEISFGIFFLHYYFILLFKGVFEKVKGSPIPGSLLYWTIDFIAVLFATVILIKIIKKIFPRNSRQLIGC